MIQARSSLESFSILTQLLATQKKVYFVRFGDGEVVSMMGMEHRNYKASPGLTQELIESFNIDHPHYLIALSVNLPFEKGMTRGVFAQYKRNNQFVEFLEKNPLIHLKDYYESQIMFHYLSTFKTERMFDFFETYIRPKKKMFIGCTEKKTAEKLYGPIHNYIQIPQRHAYDNIDTWWPKVLHGINNVELVLPSAGAASNVVAKRLWQLDNPIHLLDIGSIIDAIDEKKSRTWIKHVGHRMNGLLPLEYQNRSLPFRIRCLLKDIKFSIRCWYR